ncbi:hypothetical protein K3495_g7161 [Podosphaera aphanis]|nr:hypothetical protein K3495_g7161 [Podosphaera aphanis]
MSGTDYSYDEQGQFFPFFFLTIVGIITIPLTYSVLKPSSDPGATAPKIKTVYRQKNADLVDSLRKAQRRRELKIKRICAAIVGWLTIAGMVYLIVVTARTIPKIWNPYDILGISESATEKQIKTHYRRMSLKFHPDKIRPDPNKNETLQSLSDYFVELTKAYKALTDEEIRNNYIQYGHPDGKQSFSIGIALPKFIISDGNGNYLLLTYALMLGVLLPFLVGSWWYGTQRISKEKVLIESANNLFREFDEKITESGILNALSTGLEFRESLKGEKAESGLGKIETKILAPDQPGTVAGGLTPKDCMKLNALEDSVQRKALALLWAYLGRVDLDDASLNQSKFEVAPIAHALNSSFISICYAFGSSSPLLKAYSTAQNLVQAMSPNDPPLLQLPYFTRAIVRSIEGDSKSHLTLQEYMKLPGSHRRKISIGKELLTETQYRTAVAVARQLPRLQVEKVFFKVTGEKFVTTNSLVSLVLKARFVPPGSFHVPKVNEADLEDIDPDEGDLEAILGRKKITNQNGKSRSRQKQFQPPVAFSPYFARDYSPRWYVFLSDCKQGKIAVPPFAFSSFENPILDEDGKPTFNMQTLKAQFQAPPQAGHYSFVMHLVCDSYVGFDTKMDVSLIVEEASKAVQIEDEDDISEPDEDSIAGQMHALKSGGYTKPKKKAIKTESSDDESDTDGDADNDDDDTSETDTDTDED